MVAKITIAAESPLDLKLLGTIGSFKAGSYSNKSNSLGSLEVKYLLTKVSLELGDSKNTRLLQQLVPVREVFDVSDLGFDELMQRDIDDHRVSSELIPYLLGGLQNDIVKLFPPIVVMLLPASDDNKTPERLYPIVENLYEIDPLNEGIEVNRTRSGTIGNELFEFQQYLVGGEIEEAYSGSLGINTNKARLVIVDGQHRAMAMLAIFRNLKNGWGSILQKPYEDYYAEWTSENIDSSGISGCSLPLMICAVPELDQNSDSGSDLIKASRSIFLTLNKTARPVSSSRNVLLDDSDLLATFLRGFLENIKNRKVEDEGFLCLAAVELEQGKQQKIQQPTAITAVNHLNYLILECVVGSSIKGISQSPSNLSQRTDIATFLEYVEATDHLSGEAIINTRRDDFDNVTASVLNGLFQKTYGNVMLEIFDRFEPYRMWNSLVAQLQSKLSAGMDLDVKSLLFDAPSSMSSFDNQISTLSKKVKHLATPDLAALEALLERRNDTKERLVAAISGLREDFATDFIERATIEDGPKSSSIRSEVKSLISDRFSTVAFQCAIVRTFIDNYEEIYYLGDNEQSKELGNYVTQISAFFAPDNLSGLKALINTLSGELDDSDDQQWFVNASSTMFGNLIQGEMNPRRWTRYRAILLEIWKPKNNDLKTVVRSSREEARRQVLQGLISKKRKETAIAEAKGEDALTTNQLESILQDAVRDYELFLSRFSKYSPTHDELLALSQAVPTDDEND